MKCHNTVFTALFALASFALCLPTPAVTPPPGGGYPGFNTADGQSALSALSTGVGNTGVGWFSLSSNTDGSYNTAVGAGTLLFNAGDQNTGIGTAALFNNTEGNQNTATGVLALFNNTSGSGNTANGPYALFSNKTGKGNTATGAQALFFNDGNPDNEEASYNCAFGNAALFGNTTGEFNSAFGANALLSNGTGSFNIAIGDGALLNNIDGGNNTAIGSTALSNNTSGFQNTAVGQQALINCNTGAGNIGIGAGAGALVTTASNVICIGNILGDNIDNSCYIDNIYSNIQPVIGTDPDYVTIASNGKLGRSNLNGSSRRFKHDIQPMDKASEIIFGLKPVSFRYNKQYDAAERPSFGLIAEDVAEVAPDLVGRNKKGEPDSVRYEQINAMLLNEFLKEHKRVEQQEGKLEAQAKRIQEQETILADLKNEMRTLTAALKDPARRIQEAGGCLEISKPAPRVAKAPVTQ